MGEKIAGNVRRQIAYYIAQGYLGYMETGRECASLSELREGGTSASKRLLSKMVRDGDLEECPDHPGNVRVTKKLLDTWGLKL